MKRILIISILGIVLMNNLFGIEDFYNKKFYAADGPFGITIGEKNSTIHTATDSKEYELYDITEKSYLEKSFPFVKLKMETKEYGIFYCNIDSVEFLTLFFEKPEHPFYNISAIPLFYNKNTSYDGALLRNVIVKEALNSITETINNKPIVYTPKVWSLRNIPWAVPANAEDKSIFFTIDPDNPSVLEPVTYLVINNGYISYSKEYLYQQNSRAKTIEISYEDVCFKRELQDIANFQVVQLDKPIDINKRKKTEVRLTICDYYPGSKYSDIVISAVSFPMLFLKE